MLTKDNVDKHGTIFYLKNIMLGLVMEDCRKVSILYLIKLFYSIFDILTILIFTGLLGQGRRSCQDEKICFHEGTTLQCSDYKMNLLNNFSTIWKE
jgi:hypothetical protein